MLFLYLNALPQISHEYALLSEWVTRMCLFRVWQFLNERLHILHVGHSMSPSKVLCSVRMGLSLLVDAFMSLPDENINIFNILVAVTRPST